MDLKRASAGRRHLLQETGCACVCVVDVYVFELNGCQNVSVRIREIPGYCFCSVYKG